MVDVEATNAKLIQRQINIVVEATDSSPEQAEEALNACHRHCKTAIFMLLSGLSAAEASELLAKNQGFIRKALQGLNG
ncbi:N-acetylmuramic acid 6-phosphate etherase [Cedecea neteri]|nr:N-acetylmuramic acid 6-phosphate etherase [Cedecea neteri]